MDKEHEYASIGEFVAKGKDAGHELDKLKIEATRLGLFFEALGLALQAEPTSVVFQNETFDGRFNPIRVTAQPADVNADRIQKLVSEYRRLSVIKQDAEKAVSDYKHS